MQRKSSTETLDVCLSLTLSSWTELRVGAVTPLLNAKSMIGNMFRDRGVLDRDSGHVGTMCDVEGPFVQEA